MNEPVTMNPIMLALDIGHDVGKFAQDYVDRFNEVGGFVILKFKTRKATDAEIDKVKQSNALKKIDFLKKNGDWFSQSKDNTGKIVTKTIFVIDILKAERLPKQIEEMKIKKAQEKFKMPSVKGVGGK